MLSHAFTHVPSLPHHTHVIERAKRAKATIGGAEASEASQVGEASEASEPTCYWYIASTCKGKLGADRPGIMPRP